MRYGYEGGENDIFQTNVPLSKQIEQLDGTDILDSFNNNINLHIGIENINNKQIYTISI